MKLEFALYFFIYFEKKQIEHLCVQITKSIRLIIPTFVTTNNHKVMKKSILIFTLLYISSNILYGKASDYILQSPNQKTEVHIHISENITYSIYHQNKLLLKENQVALLLENSHILGANPHIQKIREYSKNESIPSPLYRVPSFHTSYNEMDIQLKGKYGLQFRVYNEGVAYRFYTKFKQPITIVDEIAEFNFDQDYNTFQAYSTNKKKPYAMAFQNLYTETTLSKAITDNLSFLPITIDYGKELKMTILESDLEKYPGMFIKAHGKKLSLKGHFAPYPKEMEIHPARCMTYVNTREQFIAQTEGTRTFPWRIMAITEKDIDMPVNNLVYALASPNRVGDTSWIKGGQAAWEWWNDWGISKVDFKAGINMNTYKHYIDFAAEYGLPFIVIDEGWYAPKSGDMLTVIPELNMQELIDYAGSKKVGVILWTVFNVLDKQLEEACAKYSAMGVKGFKVDFLDRDDQTAVEMVYRIAEATAKHHLTLDLHGIYKPTGLNRTYPHIINFESVFGMEEVKWSKVEKDMMKYDVTMPFIRMMAGPIDYTPGAMRNANRKDFRDVYYEPMSQGTRCHQLAAYIIHDSPLTMLADNPTIYQQEAECTKFISSIPCTGIDETQILQGQLGEYIVSARRNESDWFIGGMTNWTARDIELDFSFLPEGNYKYVLFKDGANAEKKASDYQKESGTIHNQSKMKIHLAPGGGFAINLSKQSL